VRLWIPTRCHLNRATRAVIERAGFEFDTVNEFRETRIPLPIVQPWSLWRVAK
jgi:hypothetical protein